jgi:hypothetical protein
MSEVFDVDAKFTGKKGKLKFAKGEDITFIGDIDDANTEAAAEAGANDSGNGGNTPTKQYNPIEKNDIDHLHDLKQAMEDLTKALEFDYDRRHADYVDDFVYSRRVLNAGADMNDDEFADALRNNKFDHLRYKNAEV